MKNAQILMDVGQKAQFFGLGLLAGKKLRPYAKYFIIGGIALSAAPGIMMAIEQKKAKSQSAAEQPCSESESEQPECPCVEAEGVQECDCEEQKATGCCPEHPAQNQETPE